MSYDDRMNRELADTIRGDTMADRLKDISKVGPLLDDKARAPIEFKIHEETRLPLKDIQTIVDTISGTVGQSGISAKEQTQEVTAREIKQAFAGFIQKPAFLERISNDIAKMVEGPLKDREKRIEVSKMAPATATVTAPAIKSPTQAR